MTDLSGDLVILLATLGVFLVALVALYWVVELILYASGRWPD